jgi:uncharacterized protein (TIGR03435 family)
MGLETGSEGPESNRTRHDFENVDDHPRGVRRPGAIPGASRGDSSVRGCLGEAGGSAWHYATPYQARRTGHWRPGADLLLPHYRDAVDHPGVYGDQVIGPGWLISEYYTVAANVPAVATKEQFALMLQNLLVERFKLAFHRDTKEFTVYELTVANGGAKLTPAAGDGAEEAEGAGGVEPQVFVPVSPALGKDGCPALRPGIHAAVGANDCTTFRKYSISDVVVNLGTRIALENGDMYGPQASAAHVTDKTGLSGEFDFTLKNAFHPRIPGIAGASPLGQPSEPAGGQSLSAALEKQLGLKLSKTKAKLDVLVIDHLEKIPTGN